MSCCNVRNFSWVSASLHMLFAIIGIFLSICFLLVPESDYDEDMVNNKTLYKIIFVCVLIYSLVLIGCTITLMVALKKNRAELFRPYLYAVYAGAALMVSIACVQIRRGVRRKLPIGEFAVDVVADLLIAAILAAIMIPVYMLYRQLLRPHYQPEQRALSNNQPVNKPYYSYQG